MEITRKNKKSIGARYHVQLEEFRWDDDTEITHVKTFKREHLAYALAKSLNAEHGYDKDPDCDKRYSVEKEFFETDEEPRPVNYVNLDEIVEKKDICGIIRETYWTESMSLAHVTVDGKAKPHKHDSDEVYYIINGEGHLTIDGRKDYIEAGDTISIPRGKEHFIEGKLELIVANHPGYNPSIIME